MKSLLILLLILLPLTTQSQEKSKIIRLVDSDTFLISAPFIPKPLKQQIPLRLSGVDGPGIKRWANCDKEAALGQKAKDYVQGLLDKSKKQEIKFIGMDKYNRILGDVYFDGKSVSELLIKNGYAKKYTGGKKESWCH
jgi:micrococcal nuclease